MGEAKRKRQEQARAWSGGEAHCGTIDLHLLPPVPSINGALLRELTGDNSIPEHVSILLKAFRAEVGTRKFLVGGCLGTDDQLSAVGLAVVNRLAFERDAATLHIVPIEHEDIAWDMVLRQLRTFTGEMLLFAFSTSDVYDAGMAELFYSKHIRQFDSSGKQIDRLSQAQRRAIQA